MDVSKSEIKITVAKLIEIAYSEDEGLTKSIMSKRGHFKLSVDEKGNAKLSGTAGIVAFDGTPALEGIGAKIKRVDVMFTNGDGQKINYTITIDLAIISMKVMGDFDLEELITSCSGLLCKAARLLKGKHVGYKMELNRIMGY